MAQSKKESVLTTITYYRIKKLEEHILNMEEHVKNYDYLRGRKLTQRYTAGKISRILTMMRPLYAETKELIETIQSVKKRSHENMKALHKDFCGIRKLNGKIGNEIQKASRR